MIKLLADPEDSGDEAIHAEELAAMETPQEGAEYLLDAPRAYMVTTAP